MQEQIKLLIEQQNFNELEILLKNCNEEEAIEIFLQFENNLLVEIFPKLPNDFSVKLFTKLPPKKQNVLVDKISDIQFKDISQELLNSHIENYVNSELFNKILLKAETETRHEKLLDIIDNLKNKNFTNLKPILAEMEPVDIAELVNEVDKKNVAIIFRLLPKDLASDTFVKLDSQTQETIITTFTDKELSSIFNDLFMDDTVDIIEEMPSNIVRRILKVSDPKHREDINKLMGFPKNSAGSIMTPECITIRESMTVEQSLAKIRKQYQDKETIYTLYVTDNQKHLLGLVTVKDLILHNLNDKIRDFMQDNIISAHTHADKEEVSNLLSKYDLLAIPIVDSENRINGIVTIDDAVDVIQEEAAEDISKIAGMSPTTKPYLQTSIFSIFKNRFPWLLILLLSSTFTGIIINTFESTLNSISPLLFACIPMLMGSGGNAGSQASVTVIGSLVLNEVSFKDIFKIIWKEIRVAIILAFALSLACFLKLLLIDNLIFKYNYTVVISLTVSLSLFAIVCLAKIIGACLPLFAKKCKLDPAVVASPFITTIIDALSLIIFCYFSVSIL